MPSQYAVLDIDGNGVDELIIYGNENEWGNIIVFTYKGDTQEIVPIQANLYDTGDTSRKTNVIWFCKNMEYQIFLPPRRKRRGFFDCYISQNPIY